MLQNFTLLMALLLVSFEGFPSQTATQEVIELKDTESLISSTSLDNILCDLESKSSNIPMTDAELEIALLELDLDSITTKLLGSQEEESKKKRRFTIRAQEFNKDFPGTSSNDSEEDEELLKKKMLFKKKKKKSKRKKREEPAKVEDVVITIEGSDEESDLEETPLSNEKKNLRRNKRKKSTNE